MSDIIKKILAPTDMTEFGNAAVETAASFASKLKAKLLLLHVVDLPSYPTVFTGSDGETPDQMAHEFAENQLKTIKSDPLLAALDVETCVESGKIYHSILKKAESAGADLIVMGAHGLTGIEHLILGTNARRVIHGTGVPVLTVKEPLNFDQVKKIAFASSFNQEYAYSFPKLYQYVEMFRAEVNLVKVITPKNFETTAYSKKTIEDFAESLELSDYRMHLVNDTSVEEGLSWFCKQHSIDLLFMPTHGHTAISRIWYGSHAERMGQRYSVPVFSQRMIDFPKPGGVIFPD